MKKVTALAMAAVVAASALTGCGSSSTAETTAAATEAKTEAAAAASTEAAKEDGKTYNVGICQLVQHPALDAATEGFEAALKDKISREEAKKGFIVHSLTDYEYIVYNKSMTDTTNMQFEQVLTALNQMVYCSTNNLDYEEIMHPTHHI